MRYLASMAVFLFVFGYWICEIFYKHNLALWWDLRIAIYTAVLCLSFIIAHKLTTGFTKAIFTVGIVFCIGDVIDRYFFDITQFHLNDLLLFLFAIIYLRTHYARETKTNT
jgi:hypothetical protein